MGCAANGKALENKALLAETERTVADLRGAVDQSRQETKRFQDEHDAALRERDQAVSELQEVHSQLKVKGQFTDYSEVHELRGQLREAEANLGQECSRRCRMENRVTMLEGESRALRDELLAASASKAAERKASEKFRQDVGARDAVLTELRARASQLASEHEHMAAERNDLASELEHLSRERDQAREELQEALQQAQASAAIAAAAESAAVEAKAAAAASRSASPSPGNSSKLPPAVSGHRTPVRSPSGDRNVQQQPEGRPPRVPSSSGRRSSAPSPSPEPAAATATAVPAGPPPVAERKRSSRKTVMRASLNGGAEDHGQAKRRSKGKGKGDVKAETKAPGDDERTVEPEATKSVGRRSRSNSVQQAGSVSTVESADATSTTASTVRSGRTNSIRRADKAGTAEHPRPVAPWDDDSSSPEENAGSAGNALSSGNVVVSAQNSALGRRRPSLPAAPGSAGPSPRPSLTAPWDEPDDNLQADSRSGSRTSSRRPSLTAPWDEPDEGRRRPSQTTASGPSRPSSRRPSATPPLDEPDEGRQRPSQTTAPGSRPGSRRPSITAPWDEPDEGRQRPSQTTAPGSRPGSRRPSITAPWDEPDEGRHSTVFGQPCPAVSTTAPWDELDGSASDSGSFQPAPRPKPKAGQGGRTPPTSASAVSSASAPAAVQSVQLNGKAKSGALKPPSAKSTPDKAPHAQAKPEPNENPSVQVFRFDFSVFDFLKHEVLRTPSPREQIFATEGRGSTTVGSPPVMLGAVPAAPLLTAGAGAVAAGGPLANGGKTAGNSKAVPKLKLHTVQQPHEASSNAPPMISDSSGSEVWDPTLIGSTSEVRPAARKRPTPPEILGTPPIDDGQESLGDDDWPPQARRNSAARRM